MSTIAFFFLCLLQLGFKTLNIRFKIFLRKGKKGTKNNHLRALETLLSRTTTPEDGRDDDDDDSDDDSDLVVVFIFFAEEE